MEKIFTFIIVVLSFCHLAKAQTDDGKGRIKDLFKLRIQLVDEFMQRFNSRGALSEADNKTNDSDILSLFDCTMLESDNALLEASAQFANTIFENDVKIDYSDTLWFAETFCHGKFKGQDVDFSLILNVEKRGENMYKWVIARAEGNIFQLKPSDPSSGIILMPDDHETSFMSLYRITHGKDDRILNYAQKQFKPDETSVFFSYVNVGLLDIEYVSDMQFVFYQVPGWKFAIKDFQRLEKNSGWLIKSFEKISDEEKQKTLNQLYHKN